MTGGTKTPGFPPEPGQVTARFVMITDRPVPPVMKGVPMFIYSPENRCGVFYLAEVRTTPLYPIRNHSPDSCNENAATIKKAYFFEATCVGPMPEAASFNYDHFDNRFVVFYGAGRGIGAPGQ